MRERKKENKQKKMRVGTGRIGLVLHGGLATSWSSDERGPF